MSESDTIFNERDRRCAAVQHMLSPDPSYDNRTVASTVKMQIWIASNNRDVSRVMKTNFPATVMVFGVVSGVGNIMPTHIFKVGLKVNNKVYLNVLKSLAIPWCNQVAGGRPWVWQQSKETRLGFRRSATTLYPSLTAPSSPDLNPLDYFVWSYVENITNMTFQYQSQPDRRHPPSIRRAPASTCGKGMLPVLDLYRGGYWGWRRLHWIDVSSTKQSSYLNWFFQ